jgi:hypothetical protein
MSERLAGTFGASYRHNMKPEKRNHMYDHNRGSMRRVNRRDVLHRPSLFLCLLSLGQLKGAIVECCPSCLVSKTPSYFIRSHQHGCCSWGRKISGLSGPSRLVRSRNLEIGRYEGRKCRFNGYEAWRLGFAEHIKSEAHVGCLAH